MRKRKRREGVRRRTLFKVYDRISPCFQLINFIIYENCDRRERKKTPMEVGIIDIQKMYIAYKNIRAWEEELHTYGKPTPPPGGTISHAWQFHTRTNQSINPWPTASK